MYTPYLLILTMFSGAGEIIDPTPRLTLKDCRAELLRMKSAVKDEWAVHGILRMQGECRRYDPGSWGHVAGRRDLSSKTLVIAAE